MPPRRPLPTPQEAAEILARRRTVPARRPPPPAGRSLAPLIKALDEAMIAGAHQRMGRIDILVNNAGLRVRKPFGEFTHEEFDRLVAVNLRAPFFASQAVVPIMRAQGGGHVVHMASQLGIVASRYGAVYNLTKAGLIQLTRSMALESPTSTSSTGSRGTGTELRVLRSETGM